MAGYDNTIANQNVFKPLAARNAWGENKHFEIDIKRVWDKKNTNKTILAVFKISSSYQNGKK